MNFRKTGLAMLLALTVTGQALAAEQPAAEKYRQAVQSGNFAISYDLSGVDKSYGERSSEKLYIRRVGNSKSGAYQKNGQYYYLKGNIAYTMSGEPDAEAGGNSDKVVLAERLLHNPVDRELAIFDPQGHFTKRSGAMSAPVYQGSGERIVAGSSYMADEYVMDIKSAAGTVRGQLLVTAFYDSEGELKVIQSTLRADGREYDCYQLNIKSFGSSEDALNSVFGQLKADVYNANPGAMAQVMGERGPVVEKLGGN